MVVLLEDQLGDGRAPVRLRLSLVRHGLAERARECNPFPVAGSRDARWRRGSLVVLVAWAAFMVGGAGFSKASEHFDQAVPAGSRLLPDLAFTIVAIGGVFGGCLVLAGAALAMPAFVVYLRAGGWPTVAPHFVRAVAVSAAAIGATIPLLVWAHRLSDTQRDGANSVYSVAFLGWVLLGALALSCWTTVAVSIGRHVELPGSILRLQAALATAVTATMLVTCVAGFTWWAAIAHEAPWLLHSTAAGTNGSPFNLPLTLALAVMVTATTLGLTGARQIHHRSVDASNDPR
jgi:hypothetical protein